MRFAIILAAGLAVLAPQVGQAADIIRCTSAGQADVTISLNSTRKFKRVLSCIAGDFIEDMTPCAPNGGFGLSYPTGSAALSSIVDRWQDYADHMGGVASYFSNAHQIHFSGGYMSPTDGLKTGWTFSVDRLSGKGTLAIPGKPTATFSCNKARAKF